MWAIRYYSSDGVPVYWTGNKAGPWGGGWSRLLGEAIAFARAQDAKKVIKGLGIPGGAFSFDIAMVRGHDMGVMNEINGTVK